MLIDTLHVNGFGSIGVLEADSTRHGTLLDNVPILGGDDTLSDLAAAGSVQFAVGIGSPVSGDTGARQRLYERACALGLAPISIIHPSALISASAILGAGIQIMPGAIVNAAATIGSNVIVNSGALIEHDCNVGDHVHIASRACLSGGVDVEDGAHIGAGAVVRQGTRIGAAAVVGIGAAVVSNVPAGAIVAGVPARILRMRG